MDTKRGHLRRLPTIILLNWYLIFALAPPIAAQTTQGMIRGRVSDRSTGLALAGTTVRYFRDATSEQGDVVTDRRGYYSILFLSPGVYRLRVEAADFQSQDISELTLAVAARLELDFALRPLSDVWEAGAGKTYFPPKSAVLVPFFGPDVASVHSAFIQAPNTQSGTLQATLSYMVDPQQVQSLPLSGRDIYTMLVSQPGVTADNATARGLGLTVNGQRVSSSNFLLDGVENNDYLTTGPLSVIAPEAVQEYRVSTSNFSAEFGRSAGFVANAVTRAGDSALHGLAYGYLNNDVLNATSFQRNAERLGRASRKELRTGFWAGGPVIKERLYFSASFEHFQSHGRDDPQTYTVPLLDQVAAIATDPAALQFLRRFPPPLPTSTPESGTPYGDYTIEAPVTTGRNLGLLRFDYLARNGSDRLMGRVSLSHTSQPDFIFSPYKDFTSGLDQAADSVAVSYIRTGAHGFPNELKIAWGRRNISWKRAHPEIPIVDADPVDLLGSPAQYEFASGGRHLEIADSAVLAKGRHVITVGGGLLLLGSDSLVSFYRDAKYVYDSLDDFVTGGDAQFQVSVRRDLAAKGTYSQPVYDRTYANHQFYGFAQDSFKVSRRTGLNMGVRYESFGALANTGQRDAYLQPGPGPTIEERMKGARLIYDDAARRAPYRPDRNNWAARFGVSHDLLGKGTTVLRAGYGIFFDRPFDNLTQNTRANNLVNIQFDAPRFEASRPAEIFLAKPPGSALILPLPRVLWVDQGLRTPYVQSWFGGIQQRVSQAFSVEVSHMGSLGRKLFATDKVNRLAVGETSDSSRLNPGLPNISFRSNAGSSSYQSLAALARYAAPRGQIQASYTFGHSTDNQSDALAGDFFDFSFTRAAGRASKPILAAFTRQFDSRADRGNSDFDQRHNLVLYSLWELPPRAGPGLLRKVFGGWRVSQIAGFRSGFPFPLIVARSSSNESVNVAELERNRPDLLNGAVPWLAERTKVQGGVNLLNSNAFASPAPGVVGNLERNRLIGPGFYNVDASISKSFAVRRLGEQGQVQFRADFFNLLNHANLGNPDGFVGDDSFGVALYGRKGAATGFPAVAPLNESARQIQLQLKVYF